MTDSEQLKELWKIVEEQRFHIEELQEKVKDLEKYQHFHYADPIVSPATFSPSKRPYE